MGQTRCSSVLNSNHQSLHYRESFYLTRTSQQLDMIRLTAFSFLILLLGTSPTYAQFSARNKVELGLWGGTAHYLGDIRAEYKEQPGLVRPAFGAYYRYSFDQRWAWRLSFGTGWIHSADSLSSNQHERLRNLSFRNRITEVITDLEFNFVRYVPGHPRHNFTPYLFVGVGVFFHNPQAELNGDWLDLQPLGTEGQNYTGDSGLKPYKLYQVCVPFGGGFKWSLGNHLALGFEVGYRSTYTDYLDDISAQYYSIEVLETGPNGANAGALADRSPEVTTVPIGDEGRQRGDSRETDAYIFTGISISYSFRKFVCPFPQ
jgi:hypothetical protein